ncbi:unnamed protein product [Phytomonas sp. Hart1]|nr:unnamed protein product [Phytomonas sp. Hart1]|eukprot:CCW66247.1 unnamed protein product [Phytomonas sp. isolate Hart1]
MASLTSGATSLFKAIEPFAALLKSIPHRDATHIPYAQWLSLYLESLGQRSQHSEMLSENKNEKALFRQQYCDAVDAMLLSSLMAPRWNLVLVPTNLAELQGMLPLLNGNNEKTTHSKGPAPLGASRTDLWYLNAHNCGLTLSSLVAADRFYDVGGGEDETLEVFTPKFMTEPLLGGSCLMHCTDELRQQGDLLRASKENSSGIVRGKVGVDNRAASYTDEPTIHLIIPFSCLWQIKHEAHLRSGNSAATNTSLQERGARQSLLQNIHHAFQLQADLNRLNSSSTAPSPRIKLHVSNPTEEFDMICQLPRVRDSFMTLGNANSKLLDEVKSQNFSLAMLCEKNPVRLAYFLRYSLYRIQLKRENAKKSAEAKQKDEKESEESPNELVMVAHFSEQRLFRGLGVPTLRSCSSVSSIQRQGSLKEANSASTHKKAILECGEMVRRMTTREENLRQSIQK